MVGEAIGLPGKPLPALDRAPNPLSLGADAVVGMAPWPEPLIAPFYNAVTTLGINDEGISPWC